MLRFVLEIRKSESPAVGELCPPFGTLVKAALSIKKRESNLISIIYRSGWAQKGSKRAGGKREKNIMAINVASLTGTLSVDINPARRALASIDGDFQRILARLNQVNRLNLSLPGASTGITNLRNLGAAAAQTQNQLSGLSRVAIGVAGNLGASLIQKGAELAISGVKELVDRGLDYNDVLERSKIGFTTMMGSADKANEHIKNLQAFAAKTPFEFKGLVQNSQMLQGMGFRADEIISSLNSVGNALSAMGRTDALDRVLLQLGQMRAKGKVAASEINIIAETGIPVWKIMSEQLGISVKDLQRLAEQGKLSADEFQRVLFEGLEGRFGGAMSLASKTRTGLQSNLIDALDVRAGEATSGLNEELKNSINKGIQFLSGSGGKTLADAMNTAATTAAISFNEALSAFLGMDTVVKQAQEKVNSVIQETTSFYKEGYDTNLNQALTSGASKKLGELGGSTAQGFADGIVAKTNVVTDAAKKISDSVIDSVKSTLGIFSPSRVMKVMGENVVEGFIEGIESKQAEIIATMAKVFGEKGAQSLFKKGVMFGPGFFTSGNAEWDKAIVEFSKSRGLDPALMFAQGLQESRFNPFAKSFAGAEGLMQFIPPTARRFGLKNPYDPIDSIRANADYMSFLKQKFSAFPNVDELALAGYNAGENRDTLRAGRIPNIRETQDYVRIITSTRDLIGQMDSATNLAANWVTDLRKRFSMKAQPNLAADWVTNLQQRFSLKSPEMVGPYAIPENTSGYIPTEKSIFGEPDKRYSAIMDLILPKSLQVDFAQFIPSLEKTITKYRELIPLIGKAYEVTTELDQAGQKAAKSSEISAEQQKKNRDSVIEQTNALSGIYENIQKGFEQTFQDAFGKIIQGDFKGFADALRSGFSQLLQQLAVQILQSQVMGLLFGKGGSGGLFAGLFGGLFKNTPGENGAPPQQSFLSGILSGLFGGFFADGGPMVGGRNYIVGERGPELFRPRTSGYLFPNDQLAMAGGGGGQPIQIIQNINIKAENGYVRRQSATQAAAEAGAGITRALERKRR